MMRSAVERAELYGIDLSLTDHNLSLTPEERLIQHQSALNLLNELLRARGVDPDGGSESTPEEAAGD